MRRAEAGGGEVEEGGGDEGEEARDLVARPGSLTSWELSRIGTRNLPVDYTTSPLSRRAWRTRRSLGCHRGENEVGQFYIDWQFKSPCCRYIGRYNAVFLLTFYHFL